jgi:hypothetical protein
MQDSAVRQVELEAGFADVLRQLFLICICEDAWMESCGLPEQHALGQSANSSSASANLSQYVRKA